MSSRRKQGRPQQRKILDSVEPENDLLVCGDCQTSFPLHDIVRFIRHKNHACSKENLPNAGPAHHAVHNNNDDDDKDHDDEDDEDDVCGEDEDGEGPTDLSQGPGGKMEGMVVVENGKGGGREGASKWGKEGRKPLRSRQVVDAEANTTQSEPSRFVCEVCALTVGSAWGLLQHAQKEHGMRIYNTGTSACPSTPAAATFPPSAHQPAHTRPLAQGLPAHQQRGTPKVTSSSSPLQSTEQPPAPQSSSSSTGGGATAGSFPGVLGPFFRLPSPFNRTSDLHVPVDVLEQYHLRPHLLSGVGVTLSSTLGDAAIAHVAFDRTRSLAALDSQQTYSQRLKELANPTLSAALLSQTTAPFTLPVLKPLQPKAHDGKDSAGSAGVRTTGQGEGKGAAVAAEEKKEKTSSAKEKNHSSPVSKLSSAASTTPLPGKLKTCEFCQKKFQFQSNLIVHRRSHTGEKPFRCSLCPHACSQQSKLLRHMKTHAKSTRNASLTSNTTVSSDGSTLSTGSSPDSAHHKMDDTSDLEEEEELDMEEEDEEEDMDEDFTDGDYDSDVGKGCDDGFDPLTAESDGRSDLRSNSQSDTPDTEQAPTPTKHSASASLISEVMKNSGLNCIQSYNEAFQAALEENIGKERAQDLSCKENGELKDQDGAKAQSGGDRALHEESADAGSQETSPSTGGVFSPSSFARCLPADCTSSQLPTFFPIFPSTFSLQTVEGGREKSGSSSSPGLLSAVSESALKVPTATSVVLSSLGKPVSGAALLAASNGSSPAPRKVSVRNDTCEYCGKVFKNCSNLTVHRRSHTGEKPYKCVLCSYACAQSSKLTRHMKTHGRVGKDVFRCRFCDMPFSVPSTLEKHMRKCVENRNARLLSPQAKEEEEEEEDGGKLVMDADSGSQSSPAPSMPTLSAQLQRQVSDGKGAQDGVQGDATSPSQSTVPILSLAAKKAANDSGGQDDLEASPVQA